MRVHVLRVVTVVGLAVASLNGCNKQTYSVRPTVEAKPDLPFNLVPRPVLVRAGTGVFTIDTLTSIVDDSNGDPAAGQVATYLAGLIKGATEFPIAVAPGGTAHGGAPTITLRLDPAITQPEAYTLDVTEGHVDLAAATAQGLFHGVQTLRQLLPVDIDSRAVVAGIAWTIPVVHIEDAPRFAYRGMHLDVGRHFFSVEAIKRFIDLMALYKFNTFHWHLTEDQGWRIEIKKYPKLTEVGAWRAETQVGHNREKPTKYDGQRYGGFYTQDEVRRVVAFAQARFITIVPEIEMPGHSLAALAAYPELGCTPGPFEVGKHWGIFEDIYCPKEETFTFLQDVLTEVMALFPSQYIHIGGDEAPKARWETSDVAKGVIQREGLKDAHELQSYFIQRMEKFLNTNNRRLIGWDEILEGGLAANATVMSWRGIEGGIAAARQNHDVIMTPGTHCYFDHGQGLQADEPLNIGGMLPVEKVYSYEPVPTELNPEQGRHVLGVQGNVWTEYIGTVEYLDYMAFPRAIALAEVAWSAKEQRNWPGFLYRLRKDLPRLDRRGVHYARHVVVESVATR